MLRGSSRRLRVIGDKHAGRATRWLREDPTRLDRLRHVVGVPLRVVHLVRNPFDNVASMARNRDIPVSRALEVYCGLSRGVDGIRRELTAEELLDVRYEDFLQHPESVIPAVCTFLGVAADGDYVTACATLMEAGGPRGRDTVTWSAEERRHPRDSDRGPRHAEGLLVRGLVACRCWAARPRHVATLT